jgi:hypothetical protein
MILVKVIADLLQIRGRGGRPADEHLRVQHFLEAPIHFFLIDELAAIGLGDAFTYRRAELLVFKQPQSGVFNEMLGVGAVLGRKSRELRFLLWREVDFHAIQDTILA